MIYIYMLCIHILYIYIYIIICTYIYMCVCEMHGKALLVLEDLQGNSPPIRGAGAYHAAKGTWLVSSCTFNYQNYLWAGSL